MMICYYKTKESMKSYKKWKIIKTNTTKEEQKKKYREEAEEQGIEWTEIGIKQYDRATYMGSRYFDLRNLHTRKTFSLQDWRHFLNHWDENERNNEYDDDHI